MFPSLAGLFRVLEFIGFLLPSTQAPDLMEEDQSYVIPIVLVLHLTQARRQAPFHFGTAVSPSLTRSRATAAI